MKKYLTLIIALLVVAALAACNKTTTTEKATTAKGTTAAQQTTVAQTTTEAEVTYTKMNHDEFMAAEKDTACEIECYVQAKNSWWKALTLYACDENGMGYFIYEMTCTEEEAAALEIGTKIVVRGFKDSWSGEQEMTSGSTFEVVEGADKYIAEAKDVTALIGKTEELYKYQNCLCNFGEFTVKQYSYTNEDGETVNPEYPVYGSKGEKSQGGDVYFMVENEAGVSYTFLIRSYLTNSSTDVYKAAETLKVGDTVILGGYAYWWNGLNAHITSITILQ